MTKFKNEHDQILGRDNILDFWLQEANLHSYPITIISPTEALAIISNAFSSSWLEEIISAPEKGTAIQSSRHPLAQLILVPGKNQTKKVLELAIYLRDLCAIPNLSQVIQQMKSAEDFESTWVQLAYGYRFLKLGVTKLMFEPDIDDGRKADIIFEFESQAYLVECFKPEIKDSWQVEFVTRTQKQIFEYTNEFKKVVCLKVFLRENPPFSLDERKSFEKAWKQLVRQAVDVKLITCKTDSYSIQVQEISSVSQSEREKLFEQMFNAEKCQFAWRQSIMQKDDAINTMRGKGKKTEIRDLLFIHSDKEEESISDLVHRLSNKMEKKLNQLKKREVAARGLLIVETPLIHPRNSNDRKPFDRLQGKVVKAHPHVDAAILVHGTHGPTGDSRYGGTIFQASSSQNSTTMLNKLEELEVKGPLL